MFKLIVKFILIVCAVFSAFSYASDAPAQNKKALKEYNDILVNYFLDNCKGENFNSNCPILKDLTPTGKFKNELTKQYNKNYHFFIFNNDYIWVAHGEFQKIVGKNHEDFTGADGVRFAEKFKTYADKHQQGYVSYVQAKDFGGAKSLIYIHKIKFQDKKSLYFCTTFSTEVISPELLKDLLSENK